MSVLQTTKSVRDAGSEMSSVPELLQGGFRMHVRGIGVTLREEHRWPIKPARSTNRDSSGGPAHTEARSFQLLPQLRHTDARFTLQNGMQDLRLLSELQRLLLKNSTMRHGGTEQSYRCRETTLRSERKAKSPFCALVSSDGTNKLGMARISALHRAIEELRAEAESGQIKGLIITGNDKFFSVGRRPE